jgi:hypothetical protein
MENNPFTSNRFNNVWSKHFNLDKKEYHFDVLGEVRFFKPNILPVFINIGRNLTKGISYFIDKNTPASILKNKVLLIYDVPQYFNINTEIHQKYTRIKKIKQYPGFLINLDTYDNYADYANKTFSKSSIQKLNRYNKRLETCFNISYKMLIGNVSKEEYDTVFNYFKALLIKRFEDKQITNNNLNPEEWAFYQEVAYPLLLENKAALHVIYNEDTPISVRLLYFSETAIFDAITVFDIDYTKFHIGKVSIKKMLEWSFDTKYKYFDFSKGYYDYKESWSDLKYNFEYHIVYNKASWCSTLIANAIACYFKSKQKLRELDWNSKLHKLTFFIKSKKNIKQQMELVPTNEAEVNYKDEDLKEIDINNNTYAFLRKQVYEFQFLNSEHFNDLKVYTINNKEYNMLFLIKGKNSKIIVSKTIIHSK